MRRVSLGFTMCKSRRMCGQQRMMADGKVVASDYPFCCSLSLCCSWRLLFGWPIFFFTSPFVSFAFHWVCGSVWKQSRTSERVCEYKNKIPIYRACAINGIKSERWDKESKQFQSVGRRVIILIARKQRSNSNWTICLLPQRGKEKGRVERETTWKGKSKWLQQR